MQPRNNPNTSSNSTYQYFQSNTPNTNPSQPQEQAYYSEHGISPFMYSANNSAYYSPHSQFEPNSFSHSSYTNLNNNNNNTQGNFIPTHCFLSPQTYTKQHPQLSNSNSSFPKQNHAVNLSFPKNIEHMFETFHQTADTSSCEFKPTFYNPFEIKHRKRTTKSQYRVLEKAFAENPKPSAQARRNLAAQLGMTVRGVQVWFQNRRAKSKMSQKGGSELYPNNHQQQQQSSNNILNNSIDSDCSPTVNLRKENNHPSKPFYSNIIEKYPEASSNNNIRSNMMPAPLIRPKSHDDLLLPDYSYGREGQNQNFLRASALTWNTPQIQNMKSFPNIPTSSGHQGQQPFYNIPSQEQQQHLYRDSPRFLRIPQSNNYEIYPNNNSNPHAMQYYPNSQYDHENVIPVKRSRAKSCPNVLDMEGDKELALINSMLFQGFNNEENVEKNYNDGSNNPNPLTRNHIKECQSNKRRIEEYNNYLQQKKRSRSISVPTIQYEYDFPPSLQDSYEEDDRNFYQTFPQLPIFAMPLRNDDDNDRIEEQDRILLEDGSIAHVPKGTRKNSGCSMNFLNSFLGLGVAAGNSNSNNNNNNNTNNSMNKQKELEQEYQNSIIKGIDAQMGGSKQTFNNSQGKSMMNQKYSNLSTINEAPLQSKAIMMKIQNEEVQEKNEDGNSSDADEKATVTEMLHIKQQSSTSNNRRRSTPLFGEYSSLMFNTEGDEGVLNDPSFSLDVGISF